MSIILQSSAFQQNHPIPRKFTGAGDDISPPLSWSGVPAATQELALVVDDPDALDPVYLEQIKYKAKCSIDKILVDSVKVGGVGMSAICIGSPPLEIVKYATEKAIDLIVIVKTTVPNVKTTVSPASSTQKSGVQTDDEPSTEDAIRRAAYLRWEAAGKPHGDGVTFWLEAEAALRESLTAMGLGHLA